MGWAAGSLQAKRAYRVAHEWLGLNTEMRRPGNDIQLDLCTSRAEPSWFASLELFSPPLSPAPACSYLSFGIPLMVASVYVIATCLTDALACMFNTTKLVKRSKQEAFNIHTKYNQSLAKLPMRFSFVANTKTGMDEQSLW